MIDYFCPVWTIKYNVFGEISFYDFQYSYFRVDERTKTIHQRHLQMARYFSRGGVESALPLWRNATMFEDGISR